MTEKRNERLYTKKIEQPTAKVGCAAMLGILAVGFLAYLAGIAIMGVLLAVAWNVALSPLFGLPNIDPLQGAGLAFLISVLGAIFRRAPVVSKS